MPHKLACAQSASSIWSANGAENERFVNLSRTRGLRRGIFLRVALSLGTMTNNELDALCAKTMHPWIACVHIGTRAPERIGTMTTIDALPRPGDPHVMVIDLASSCVLHGMVGSTPIATSRDASFRRRSIELLPCCRIAVPSHVVIADDAEDLFCKRLHPG